MLWTPLLNGYPLLHADSGTYIWSSVIFLVPQDRPIGYSLFLRTTLLVPSLWALVIVQALGTAYLLWRVADRMLLRVFPARAARSLIAFGIGAATVLLTSISTYVGFVLADILASWIFLGAFLFFLAPRTSEKVLAAFAIVAGVWSHNSHVLLAFGLALPITGYFLLKRRARPLTLRPLGLFLGILVLVVAGLLAVNLYLRAGAEVTRGGDTIWLARFSETGVLQDTLTQNCAARQWTLCESLDKILAHQGEPRWFLFGQDSPVNQIGWEKGTAEQRTIVLAALECCLPKIIASSAAETWRQVWLLKIAPYLVPLAENMNAVLAIQKNFPHELNAFQTSRQQTNQTVASQLVPLDESVIQIAFLAAALFAWVYGFWKQRWREVLFLSGAIYFILLNALVMATFSGAVSRYQARIYWLLPYAVLVVLAAYWGAHRTSEHGKFETQTRT